MTKDFRVTLRLRNNRLLTLIEDKFWTTAEMARQTGMNPSNISALITMRDKPTNDSGWTKAALDISSALGVIPSEIWPEHMEDVRLNTSTADVFLDAQDAVEMLSDGPDTAAMRDLIAKAGQVLTDREIKVLECVYGGATLDEVGAENGGISRERVRQIACIAQKKMRNRLHFLRVTSMGDVV